MGFLFPPQLVLGYLWMWLATVIGNKIPGSNYEQIIIVGILTLAVPALAFVKWEPMWHDFTGVFTCNT